MNQKGIRILVTLDSCHSGGAWRDAMEPYMSGRIYRTPKDWGTVPNSETDKTAAKQYMRLIHTPTYRDAVVEKSWGINPDGFILIAACKSDQRAAEWSYMDEVGGAFTHHLLKYLKAVADQYTPTYRMIVEQVHSQIGDQQPEAYGYDKFLFLQDRELSCKVLKVNRQGRQITLPCGKAYGIHKGAEFVSYNASAAPKISVSDVRDFNCTAQPSDPSIEAELIKHHGMVIQTRWSLGEEVTIKLVVHQKHELGQIFQTELKNRLEKSIANPIKVTENKTIDDTNNSKDFLFKIQYNVLEGIKIVAPQWLAGYEGPVRPLNLGHITSDLSNAEQLARETAIAIIHLTRFGHTLRQKSEWNLPVKVKIEPTGCKKAACYGINQKFTCTVANNMAEAVYVAMFNFSPEFKIQEMRSNSMKKVERGQCIEVLPFHMQLPEKPSNDNNNSVSFNTELRRDIIRVMITTKSDVTWANSEIPGIWERINIGDGIRDGSSYRDAGTGNLDDRWAVYDETIMTSDKPTAMVINIFSHQTGYKCLCALAGIVGFCILVQLCG